MKLEDYRGCHKYVSIGCNSFTQQTVQKHSRHSGGGRGSADSTSSLQAGSPSWATSKENPVNSTLILDAPGQGHDGAGLSGCGMTVDSSALCGTQFWQSL